jgi:hypothetical protein
MADKTPAPAVDPALVTPDPAKQGPVWKGSLSATEPIVAPDGHVVLSVEDIEARDAQG